MSLFEFFVRNHSDVLGLTLEHLLLVAAATGAASAVGIPLGVLLTRRPSLSKPVLAFANILQTIPSLALFGFLIPLLGSYGIGRVPAVIALFLYSLLPIIRNTFTGISGVDPSVREAAKGMGMTDWQMLIHVDLPLALSVIIAGVRVATVIAVGTATIAAAIGAGGLGTYIFRGLRMYDNTLILAGAVPAAAMALAADLILGWIEKSLVPGRSRVSRRRKQLATAAIVVGVAAGVILLITSGGTKKSVVIGSKDFTEQVILGELLSQLIESQSQLTVERRFELGGDLCHRALLQGEIDAYVEYTGTAFTAILKHPPISDPAEVYRTVKADYENLYKLVWLEPLGFNNTFAILVRGEEARRLGLKKISEVTRHALKWRAAFGQDFMSRKDGYPGFAQTYGLKFARPPGEMDLSLTYRALATGQVDLIAGNSTDGLIDKLDLYQLEDDRRYFPPYEAAAVFRRETAELYPEMIEAVRSLTGKLTNSEMRRLNYAVDGDHREVKEVVREFLSGLH